MLVNFIFCFVMYSGLTPATQEIKPKSDFNKDVQDIQDKNLNLFRVKTLILFILSILVNKDFQFS